MTWPNFSGEKCSLGCSISPNLLPKTPQTIRFMYYSCIILIPFNSVSCFEFRSAHRWKLKSSAHQPTIKLHRHKNKCEQLTWNDLCAKEEHPRNYISVKFSFLKKSSSRSQVNFFVRTMKDSCLTRWHEHRNVLFSFSCYF